MLCLFRLHARRWRAKGECRVFKVLKVVINLSVRATMQLSRLQPAEVMFCVFWDGLRLSFCHGRGAKCWAHQTGMMAFWSHVSSP